MDLSLVQSNTFNMRWWVLILLPLHLLAQETYNDCAIIQPQSYQVDYEADKIYYWSISHGDIISASSNTITVQWPDSAGDYLISVYTTRFGCDGDTSEYQVSISPCPYATLFFPSSFTPWPFYRFRTATSWVAHFTLSTHSIHFNGEKISLHSLGYRAFHSCLILCPYHHELEVYLDF